MTTIKCRDHTFELNAKQEAFLAHARARKMPFAYFDCQSCSRSVKLELSTDKSVLSAPLGRCPVAGCAGWVVDISDIVVDSTPKRWGCGACSTTWIDDKSLFAAVKDIIRKFPHRAAVYVRKGSKWAGVSLSGEPRDYVAQVEREKLK